MDVADAVDDVWSEALGESLGIVRPRQASATKEAYLVADNLAFGIVLEVSVALEAPLDDLAELGSKGLVVEQVVYTQARARGLARVRRTDALLGGANAALYETYTKIRKCGDSPRSSELDLLQSVNNLVEIKHEMSTIGDEQASGAVQSFASVRSYSTVNRDTTHPELVMHPARQRRRAHAPRHRFQ